MIAAARHAALVLPLFLVNLQNERAADSPAAFGRTELASALASMPSRPAVDVRVDPVLAPQCFEINNSPSNIEVRGGDEAGAMYGALEVAERIKNGGAAALAKPIPGGKPFLNERGLNLFLTLPWDYDKNTADQSEAALANPARWWFHDDDYWRTLLDEMARARLNWLDLHGAYDLDSTRFPNFYAYFIQSELFPEVGVAKNIKEKNLARFNQIIDWAHARGIKVSFMAYEASFWTPQKQKTPYVSNEKNLYDYTREVVEKSIRLIPKLDAIGFRIGESGHGGEFFNCYLDAVKASGRDIPLYTRSWVTKKDKVVPLARGANDFTVEIKYNGEQWGPPYMVAGGRVPLWYSYSFEDYFSDSRFIPGPTGAAATAKKMWPGNVSESGAHWPDQPYKIVWQVRANGTHRIFPFYNPQWVRRTIGCMNLGTTSGYTVEPMNAYYPASPRYYLKDATNYPYKWIHERDWMYLMCWGRLGYDNNTPEDVFDRECARFLGKGTEESVQAWKAASLTVPIAFTSFAFGPDHRDHAPELEMGGDVRTFIESEPFDESSIKSSQEEKAYTATRSADGRSSQYTATFALRDATRQIDGRLITTKVLSTENAPPICKEASKLYDLGGYYVNRFREVDEALSKEIDSNDSSYQRITYLDNARGYWNALSDSNTYKPFTDRLRMGTHAFHWNSELSKLDSQLKGREKFNNTSSPQYRIAHFEVPDNLQLTVNAPAGDRVTASVRWDVSRGGTEFQITRAWILTKLLPSSTFYHRIAAVKSGDHFEASFPYELTGHLVAADVEIQEAVDLRIVRIPDWLHETPYKVVPPKPEPTPQIYSFEEALAHLDPAVLNPDKYGMLFVGPRAWAFHKHFDVQQKAKLLDAVERGMDLLILQQDWASGRYPLDWLPDPPRVENYSSTTFDPDGALGLSKIETAEILYQRFLPSTNWTIHGNGGVASRTFGKGHIYMVSARLMQRMHIPDCAKAIVTLLKHGDVTKPVVVVDSCSEGPRYSNSFFQDMMNAQGIPFLTLGEVVAREQGMNSYKIVPGIVDEHSILGGAGDREIAQYYDKRVRAAASRPAPKDAAEFEPERARRKAELLKCLGLDPEPPKTPLNAKVVSTLRREGYTIENILFESRPDFPVTAHLYLPEGADNKKLPLIVNVNGHWAHKVHEPVEQARAIAQALHGYLALTVDSPGYSFEGDAKIERRGAGPHDDYRLIVASENTTAIYVWDLIRALDVIESRGVADMSKIGITGVSGGGLATLYAFAADERYSCAVPVCYPSSMETTTANGCLCNHVPGTLQIGDRADVLAIRAPKPVFVIGASDDGEFPPAGTKLTGDKLKKIWRAFGAEKNVDAKIYKSGHDYNKEMREAAMGFFDLHLLGTGDGVPVPEPNIKTDPPDAPETFSMDPAAETKQKTMHQIAVEHIAATARETGGLDAVVAINGGAGAPFAAKSHVVGVRGSGSSRKELLTIEVADPPLRIPGILEMPQGESSATVILFSDAGKSDPELLVLAGELRSKGMATLRIDVPGTGELANVDYRLLAYLGESVAFSMARAAARAADLYAHVSRNICIVGRGPGASLAALYATALSPNIKFTASLEGIGSFADALDPAVSALAIQPRADQLPKLQILENSIPMPHAFLRAGEKPAVPLADVIRANLPR
ncbi:MAG: prolyl oligopeptidase family serine peptidase [Planctomycetes bacterium]|nr:prolyl oligopeptidase family serine peptidase [Planctomycetota bacterium]